MLQGGSATDVIEVVMGQQDGAQLQLSLVQCVFDDLRIAWVYDNGVAVIVVKQPDVVVGQGW